MQHEKQQDGSIALSETHAVIRKKGVSRSTVAVILYREQTAGIETIWLDRRIHRLADETLGGFALSGAISTILTRTVPHPSASAWPPPPSDAGDSADSLGGL